MTNVPSSGIEPGQCRLNGPQTTGREYRNLSQPTMPWHRTTTFSLERNTSREPGAPQGIAGRWSLSRSSPRRSARIHAAPAIAKVSAVSLQFV
jgi:hypothetical protein